MGQIKILKMVGGDINHIVTLKYVRFLERRLYSISIHDFILIQGVPKKFVFKFIHFYNLTKISPYSWCLMKRIMT